MPKLSALLLPVQQCGCSAASRSLLFFFLDTDSFTSCHGRLLKTPFHKCPQVPFIAIYISLCYPCKLILLLDHFTGLLNNDFTFVKKCLSLLSTSSDVVYSQVCEDLIAQRFNSCKYLSSSIINNLLHALHPCLANALSASYIRSSLKLLRQRSSLFRNSLIPNLTRYLVNPKQGVDL